MTNLLFTIPLKVGQLAAYQSFGKEITTRRQKEYADLLKRYGLQTAKVWHCKIDKKDYVMVLHQATEEAMDLLKNWSTSTHPFDLWFNEQLLKFYDIPSLEENPVQTNFLYSFSAI